MDPARPVKNRYDPLMGVLVGLASLALVIDLWDGQTNKTISSAMIVVGLLALWRSRRFNSIRWRTVAWAAFGSAFAAFVYRLALWQDWA